MSSNSLESNSRKGLFMSGGARARVSACPKCSKGELERVRTPRVLRLMRAVPGLHPRAYRCDFCMRTHVEWRDSLGVGGHQTQREEPDPPPD